MNCCFQSFCSQFKVLLGGHWKEINFDRAVELQLKKADGSKGLLASPWIRHFRSGCTPRVVASVDLQNNVASTSEALDLVGNHRVFCGSDTCNLKHNRACHFHLDHHDLVSSDTGAFSYISISFYCVGINSIWIHMYCSCFSLLNISFNLL